MMSIFNVYFFDMLIAGRALQEWMARTMTIRLDRGWEAWEGLRGDGRAILEAHF